MPLEVGCRGFTLQSLECTGHHHNGEEKSHQEHHRGSGEILEMALDQEVVLARWGGVNAS